MNLEKELAQEVLNSIESEETVEVVDYHYKRYFRSLQHKPYDIKLFNEIDRKHTKYLLRNLT